MESKHANVDLSHIFLDAHYIEEETISKDKVYIVLENNHHHRYYLLIKKAEEYKSNTKYTFINQCEKSFELIHPSIINLSGFSIQKPNLYYKCSQYHHKIDDIELTDENIQKMFLGIASGLSYLLLKGFYYENFSTSSSLIFDKNNFPKLFDYINFEDSNKEYESDLIVKYADLLTMIINKKKKEESEFLINEDLQKLIDRCHQKTNMPTFDDFILFFQKNNYCKDINVIKDLNFKRYMEILQYTDKIIYDKQLSSNRFLSLREYSIDILSLESVCFYFYQNRKKNDKKFDEKYKEERYLLNFLPEYYIKPMVMFFNKLTDKYQNYLYYEDLSIFIPEWRAIVELNYAKNPFKIYKKLIKKMKSLEHQINEVFYFYSIRKKFEIQLDAVRIQAIYFLKEASKNSNNPKIKIELAVQYINGSILPYNLTKALDILNKIVEAGNAKTQKLIDQMKAKIKSMIDSSKIENIINKIQIDKREILEKAVNGDVISLIYTGFAFYTGFNKFPILRSLAIQHYRAAAKKSPSAMALLGWLYLNGVIFPQNFKRAKNCFKRAAINGDMKAEIIDNLLRKHFWRSYSLDFDAKDIMRHYLPSFKSMIPNDAYIIPFMIYNIHDDQYEITLQKEENALHSEIIKENYSLFIDCKKKRSYISCNKDLIESTTKIYLSSENIENEVDANELLKIGNSYFYGDNNFPVNYQKAIKFYKSSADKGNSEAQWRYALMCLNSIGIKNEKNNVEKYLQKSIRQNNPRGKLLYALFIRNQNENYSFEQMIQECCNSGDPDAMYFYAMHLENDKSSLDKPKEYYENAAKRGHLNSLIRLIYFLRHQNNYNDLHDYYTNLSVGILNESLLIKKIIFYDRRKKYNDSNILIQIGIKLNYQLFNAFYADHLLYGKGMNKDEQRAEKFVFLAFSDNFPEEYWERYIYVMLELFIRRKQHQEAADFLLKHRFSLTEKLRRRFLLFYKKLDKNIAHHNFITVNFCNKYYQNCIKFLLELNKENVNIIKVLTELHKLVIDKDNPYAMAVLGKIYKQGKYTVRNLKKAVKLFALSAQKECPEGYYYLGKEYFYGRLLNQDFDLAKHYFIKALINIGEPRAAFYLYKIRDRCNKKKINCSELLKISAIYGYKRSLYKYGHLLITGKDPEIQMNLSEGQELIRQAAKQHYKKAIKYCKLNNISLDYLESEIIEDEHFDLIKSLKIKKIKLDVSIDEDYSFSDIETDTDDENINQIINNIKIRKGAKNLFEPDSNTNNDNNNANANDNNNNNDNNSSDNNNNNNNDIKVLSVLSLLENIDISKLINGDDNDNSSKSNNDNDEKSSNEGNSKKDENETSNISLSLSGLKINKKNIDLSSSKISKKDTDLSSSKRGKKSTDFSSSKISKKDTDLSSSKISKKDADLSSSKISKKNTDLSSSKRGKKSTDFSSSKISKKDADLSSSKKEKKKTELNVFEEEEEDISELMAFWF